MNNKPLASRTEALKAGINRYFTGRPCLKGHISERRATTGACMECVRKAVKEHNKKLKRLYKEALAKK